MSGSNLPSNWIQTKDQYGRAYYYNLQTRETSWVPPQQQQQQPQKPPPPHQKLALPAGWEESVDPKTGRIFYIDHINKRTSWTPPPVAAAAAAATVCARGKKIDGGFLLSTLDMCALTFQPFSSPTQQQPPAQPLQPSAPPVGVPWPGQQQPQQQQQ
jgi:hypothetical protein